MRRNSERQSQREKEWKTVCSFSFARFFFHVPIFFLFSSTFLIPHSRVFTPFTLFSLSLSLRTVLFFPTFPSLSLLLLVPFFPFVPSCCFAFFYGQSFIILRHSFSVAFFLSFLLFPFFHSSVFLSANFNSILEIHTSTHPDSQDSLFRPRLPPYLPPPTDETDIHSKITNK